MPFTLTYLVSEKVALQDKINELKDMNPTRDTQLQISCK